MSRNSCRLASDDVVIEKHTNNTITGTARTFRRSFKRSCVPMLDAIVRIVFAVGLVAAIIILAVNMDPDSLMRLKSGNEACIKRIDDCMAKLNDSSLVVSNRVSTLQTEVSQFVVIMIDITNGLWHVKNRVGDYEREPKSVRWECHAWCRCPCCHRKVGFE